MLARSENPEEYKKSIEPLLHELQQKYRDQIPVGELQRFISAEKLNLKAKMKGLVASAATEGKTISLESLRQTMEKSKTDYKGSDRDVYNANIDNFIGSLKAQYGEQIPVEDAFKLLQKLEGAAGQTDTINQP